MKQILICSVRNSGTHFMMRCLSDKPVPWLHQVGLDYEGDVLAIHSYHPKFIDYIRSFTGRIVVPVRKYEDILESHQSRCELPLAVVKGRLDEHLAKLDKVKALNPFYFDMKTKPFKKLEKYLGRPVNRDTSIVRHPMDS